SRWSTPLLTALRKGDYLMLVPPMMAGFLFLQLTRAGRTKLEWRFLVGALASILVGIGIYLFFYMILDVSVIAWEDYTVLFFPIACVGAIATLGEISMTLSQRQRIATLLSFAVVQFGMWLVLPKVRSLELGPWLLVTPLLLFAMYA